MANYVLDYSGAQINTVIGKVLNPDTTPIEDSNNLITSGGVKAYVDENQGASILLQSIAITTPPIKTAYSHGEAFDPTGMVVTATYYVFESETTITAEVAGYSYSPSVITTETTSVTISYSEGNRTVTATQLVEGWVWGDETADADENWFKGLQAKARTDGADSNWVGKTKSVTLTSTVLGTTTHLIRCIGVNQDGDNTVTFQTKNCLYRSCTFGSSDAKWISSTVRTQCQNYQKAFPGKSFIKTVRKGTCSLYSSNRNTVPAYNDETVWLPSEREMGLNSASPISVANSTTTKAECTYGYNASYAYYSSNGNRLKNAADSGSSGVQYWMRSMYNASGSTSTCVVSSSGSTSGFANTSSFYLAPAFVIG